MQEFPSRHDRRGHMREKGNGWECHSHSGPAITLVRQCQDAEGATHMSSRSPHCKWGFRSNWTSSQKFKSVEGCSKQKTPAVQMSLSQKLPQARIALGMCYCCLPCSTTAPSLSISAQCLTQCWYSCLRSLFCLFEGCQLVCICPIFALKTGNVQHHSFYC